MAFATANVKTTYWGNLKVLYGDWTGSAGDSAGSIVVEGGKIVGFQFFALLANGTTYQPTVQINQSVSGALSTVTVNNTAAVTSGQFYIVHQ